VILPHATYTGLGHSDRERQAAYRELFRLSISDADMCLIRDATQYAWALGGAAFRTKVEALSRRAERLPLGRPPSEPRDNRESRV